RAEYCHRSESDEKSQCGSKQSLPRRPFELTHGFRLPHRSLPGACGKVACSVPADDLRFSPEIRVRCNKNMDQACEGHDADQEIEICDVEFDDPGQGDEVARIGMKLHERPEIRRQRSGKPRTSP